MWTGRLSQEGGGNSGAPIKTMLKEHAGNFDVSKPYHTIKLYMAKGETAVTDVDYIKVYKEERLCEAYLSGYRG